MRRRTATVLGAPVAWLLIALAPEMMLASPSGAAGRALFRLSDPRIAEASGLGVGIRSPGVLYVQNDSGDRARFFALDATSGYTLAVLSVPGAVNHDWEDLAVARDAAGVPSVWLADTGDNSAARSEVQVYRVDEPGLVAGIPVGERATTRPDVWRLRYPDGAHDTESMAVDPVSHRIYLFTKSLSGVSEVFEAPPQPSTSRVQQLVKVGSIQFSLTGTPGGPNFVGQLTATGASMAEDGSLLVLRTYTDAYLWPVSGGDIAAAIRRDATVLALPPQPQGEGIALRGGQLLIDSERALSTVYSVPLPALPHPPGGASGSPASVASTSPAAASGAAADRGVRRLILAGSLVIGLAVVVAMVRGLLWWSRRRLGR
jgi:hypothetical protein